MRATITEGSPVMSLQDKRNAIHEGLVRMAHDIQVGNLPCPYGVEVSIYWQTTDDGTLGDPMTTELAREAMANVPGSWNKTDSTATRYTRYERHYGEHVSYELAVDKGNSDTCRMVPIGTRVIEQHEVTDYVWECNT